MAHALELVESRKRGFYFSRRVASEFFALVASRRDKEKTGTGIVKIFL